MAGIKLSRKFRILLWKNFTLQWHRKCQMVANVLVPVLMIGALLLIRSFVMPTSHPGQSYMKLYLNNINILRWHHQMQVMPVAEEAIPPERLPTPAMFNLKFEFLFTPPNPLLENIVRITAQELGLSTPSYRAIDGEDKFEEELTQGNYLAGIQFDESLRDIKDYPKSLKYTLRLPLLLRTNIFTTFTWYIKRLLPIRFDTGPRNPGDSDGGLPAGYYREGFLSIQNIIAMTFIKLASKNEISLPQIIMQRFPDPPFIQDSLVGVISKYMPLFIMLSYMQMCMAMVKEIALEKENQLKEILKVLGINNWIHWLAWFTKAFVTFAFVSIIITALLTINFFEHVAVLTYSNPFAIYLVLLVYCINCICSSFMFAVFFSKAGTASSFIVMFFFITYFPYTIFNEQYHQLSFTNKISWSLLTNTAMGFAFHVILLHEAKGVGLQFSNMFTPSTFEDQLTVGHIIIVMLFSCLISMIICLYVEKVLPGTYGVPYPWYFPLKINFWTRSQKNDSIDDLKYYIRDMRKIENFQNVNSEVKSVGIEAIGLKKKYNKKWVVSNFTLNLYRDEITVLLGHNGAGKTTTMSMLAGMCDMTSGTAYINGYDIKDSLDEARQSMGVVLQHNVLFDDLTVVDHLRLFAMVKGLEGIAIDQEVNYYMEKINLVKKANVAAKNLSGGMKRKLCLVCALCGNTDVVLLDEPSEGLDPLARRQVWDLLQREKIGRTILLSSQLLDEADVIADRIVIMASGEMVSYGTPYFMKKKFSMGYQLVCVRNDQCNVDEVTELLSQYIEDLMPETVSDSEITYRLLESKSSVFDAMFLELERRADELKISGFGIRTTSLEEVFMQIGKERGTRLTFKNDIQGENIFNENPTYATGLELMINQWVALFIKKITYTRRRWMMIVAQFFLPIYFVALSILVAGEMDLGSDAVPMTISLAQYPGAKALMEIPRNAQSFEIAVAKHYKDIVDSYGNNFNTINTANQPVGDFILQERQESLTSGNTDHLVAATFGTNTMTVWLNNELLHTAPLTLNILHNAISRHVLGNDSRITIINHPVATKVGSLILTLMEGQQLGILLTMNISLCLSFALSFYILFIVTERHTRGKLLQFISGAHFSSFWLTHFLWDIAMYATTVIMSLLVLYAFQSACCTQFDDLARIFCFMMLFGMAGLIWNYVFAFIFTDPSTAFLYASGVAILLGVIPFLTFFLLQFVAEDFVRISTRIFYMVPHFSFAHGMNNLYTNILNRKTCDTDEIKAIPDKLRCLIFSRCCNKEDYWALSKPGILEETLYILLTGFIFFIILVVIDCGLVNKFRTMWQNRIVKKPPPVDESQRDSDVLAEAKLIENMSQSEKESQLILMDRVTKFYGKFLAVNQVSAVIKRKECFGLLGINGAGKTTTFNIMTGDEALSYGDAYMNGINLRTRRRKVKKNYGYCPQFDALLDFLSVRQTVEVVALLRGINRRHVAAVTEELSNLFGFTPYLDISVKKCSGGIRRKLSAAIALIGSPPVLFLDEPTSSMDPVARQQIFQCLSKLRESGKSLVLTSHVLDECEGLCTRLVIMVNGNFKCMGSVQHLKNKFSKGLTLKIISRTTTAEVYSEFSVLSLLKGKPAEHEDRTMQNIKDYMQEEIPEATLVEEHKCQLTYSIPPQVITLSQLFGELERHRVALNIEDYTINQTTLEDIFLEFAREQHDENIDVTTARR